MSRPPARIICNTLVQAARCVICTPAGVRVEPEVYCRYARSSVSRAAGTNVAPTASGTASIAITRGRRPRGSLRRNVFTDSAAPSVVRMTDGVASASTASRRSAWPGSSGANNGTAMFPAWMAAKNPIT
ncbi:Uncharacterised protein [Mycobacteroides abscessus subsp. massiliense]|nr:Uncharacterised protein [Mycobacteroides abscessus subsp. massiliense]